MPPHLHVELCSSNAVTPRATTLYMYAAAAPPPCRRRAAAVPPPWSRRRWIALLVRAMTG